MAKQTKLRVIQESESGMNQKFLIQNTGEVVGRQEMARKIDAGEVTGYHHYRNDDNKLIIRSNPDSSDKNNLG